MSKHLPDYFPAVLEQQAKTHELQAGDVLFEIGDPVVRLFYVHSGELKAIRYLPDGNEVTMLRARQGELLGESTFAIDNYICQAKAMGPARLSSIPIDAVREVFKSDTEFAYRFMLMVAKTSRVQCSRYERLRLKNAADRVMHYLLCESGPDCSLEYPTHLYEWAHELGLQKETLYRTLAALEKAGKIKRTDRMIRLLE